MQVRVATTYVVAVRACCVLAKLRYNWLLWIVYNGCVCTYTYVVWRVYSSSPITCILMVGLNQYNLYVCDLLRCSDIMVIYFATIGCL